VRSRQPLRLRPSYDSQPANFCPARVLLIRQPKHGPLLRVVCANDPRGFIRSTSASVITSQIDVCGLRAISWYSAQRPPASCRRYDSSACAQQRLRQLDSDRIRDRSPRGRRGQVAGCASWHLVALAREPPRTGTCDSARLTVRYASSARPKRDADTKRLFGDPLTPLPPSDGLAQQCAIDVSAHIHHRAAPPTRRARRASSAWPTYRPQPGSVKSNGRDGRTESAGRLLDVLSGPNNWTLSAGADADAAAASAAEEKRGPRRRPVRLRREGHSVGVPVVGA
jgi:hypothetical protein